MISKLCYSVFVRVLLGYYMYIHYIAIASASKLKLPDTSAAISSATKKMKNDNAATLSKS